MCTEWTQRRISVVAKKENKKTALQRKESFSLRRECYLLAQEHLFLKSCEALYLTSVWSIISAPSGFQQQKLENGEQFYQSPAWQQNKTLVN